MVPKKVPQYRSTGDLVRSWGVHRHPYCRGLSFKGLSALGDLRGPLEGLGGAGHCQGPSGVDP